MSPYKVISVLLLYPDRELLAARDEIAAAVTELPNPVQRRAIERFLEWCCGRSTTELQQEYVSTFDFARRSSLYLSFHLHGDRRQRGMALLRLKQRYAVAGLFLSEGELPDYLPVMLEFASLAPDGAGDALLAQHREAIELVRASLRDEGSPYAQLLDAVCESLPKLSPAQLAEVRRLAAEGPPTEQVGLEPFAPPEVMPGPAQAPDGCPVAAAHRPGTNWAPAAGGSS